MGVHPLQHVVEGRTKPVAPPAAVADLGHPRQLPLDGGAVEIGGVPGVVGQLQLFQAVQALGEAAGVAALGLGQRLEPLGDLREALLAGGPGHARIHLRVLVGLSLDGRLEVLFRIAESDVGSRIAHGLQEVHVSEGMAGLRLGSVAEEPADLGVSLDVGTAREVHVPTVRLRFGGEGLLKAHYYILCPLSMRYADPSYALTIMAHSSIGTTPILLGLNQDLPRAKADLQEFLSNQSTIENLKFEIARILRMVESPEALKVKKVFTALGEKVKTDIGKKPMLRAIASEFLTHFMDAGRAGLIQLPDFDFVASHGLTVAIVPAELLEDARRDTAFDCKMKRISFTGE